LPKEYLVKPEVA